MKTLIQVAEIWVPDADGYLLELADGQYGSAVEFGATSRAMCFGKGEGLPGRTWEEGAPVLLKNLQGGYFRRAKTAAAAGLSCAVAWPVVDEGRFKAVAIVFCSGEDWGAGSIEIWRGHATEGIAPTLIDGYYGPSGAAFDPASGDTSGTVTLTIDVLGVAGETHLLKFASATGSAISPAMETWLDGWTAAPQKA